MCNPVGPWTVTFTTIQGKPENLFHEQPIQDYQFRKGCNHFNQSLVLITSRTNSVTLQISTISSGWQQVTASIKGVEFSEDPHHCTDKSFQTLTTIRFALLKASTIQSSGQTTRNMVKHYSRYLELHHSTSRHQKLYSDYTTCIPVKDRLKKDQKISEVSTGFKQGE